MSKFWNPLVSQLTPYVPGEQPAIRDLIKLNTNECPYGPSPVALVAIREAADDALRLYPDPEARDLKDAIADNCQLPVDHIFVGNGSDEILAHTFFALLKHDKPLLFPGISYGFYPVYCRLYGIEAKPVPLREDFSIAVDDYPPSNGGIVIANPNAPTGLLLPLADIEALVQRNPDSVVVIDEAYIDFGGQSAASLIPRYPNLLVIQTLSKSRALAGLRVGFALGQPPLIEGLERTKDSFNSFPLDRLAQAGAAAALRDTGYFQDLCRKVIDTRERLSRALKQLGFTVVPSAANFVFTSHPRHAAADLAARLRAASIIVRHFDKPGIENYLRISIGTDSEIDRLIAVLEDITA